MPVHLLIRKRRETLGLTLHELAKRLRKLGIKCDHSSLSRLENGKRDVPFGELQFYAKALECRVLDLIEEVPNGNGSPSGDA